MDATRLRVLEAAKLKVTRDKKKIWQQWQQFTICAPPISVRAADVARIVLPQSTLALRRRHTDRRA